MKGRIVLQNRQELEDIVNSVTNAAREQEKKRAEAEAAAAAAAEAAAAEQAAAAAEEAAPQPTPAQEDKMAAIKAALAHNNEEEEPAAQPLSHEELKPLHRINEHRQETRKAAADTTEIPALRPASHATVKPASEKDTQPHHTPVKSVKPAAKKAGAPATGKKSGKKGTKPAKKTKAPKPVSGNPKKPLIYAGGIGASVLVACLIGFVVVAGTYKGKFLPNTLVNTVDVAGMTTEEASYTLIKNMNAGDLHLLDHNGKEVVFNAADFDASYSVPNGALAEAADENPYTWVGKLFGSSEYQITYDYHYNADKLRKLIKNYDWGDAVSTDAHIVRQENGDFTIEKETLGDQFDVDILMNYLGEQLADGKVILNMDESGCYGPYMAQVTADTLQGELELYNSYAKCNITFDFDDRKKKVDSAMIVDWIMTLPDGSVMKDHDGGLLFDRDKVGAFVQQMAAETDTWGTSRSFYATLDGWITVPWNGDYSSTYGWLIDQDATIDQLIELMREGKSATVEPVYKQKGLVRGADDIGTTYVEVDISAQHMWVYKNNVVVLESDIVSGTETDKERRTPRGICQIWSHESPRKLGTYAVQGYECWVDYWMPFNYLGCGFHDLSRSRYGGSIYMYNGSHGCINLPHSVAKEMYNITFNGMPAIIHD